MKKIFFVINDLDFFISHRLPIAIVLKEEGYDVSVVCPESKSVEVIQRYHIGHIPLDLSRKGMNPFFEIMSLFSLYRIFKKHKPDLVHLVTIKPVVYGGIAARLAGVRSVVAAITGLGFVFIAQGFVNAILKKLIIALYKISLNHSKLKVIFQNTSDLDVFLKNGLISENQSALIKGSGVDLNLFKPFPENDGSVTIVMIARLLRDKGVFEFYEAARIIKEKDKTVQFLLVGDIDEGNPASLTIEELNQIKNSHVVQCLGYRKDISEIMKNAHVVVLPSYREGLPKTLVEAAACGRATVTTTAAGCKDAILDGVTGFAVPVKDAKALAEKFELLKDFPQSRKEMGIQGRKFAEENFDIKIIVQQHLDIYKNILR